MTLILGPAPIADFDGTIARLPVDWNALRHQLNVRSVRDLWALSADEWDQVTEAEVRAAALAEPLWPVLRRLAGTSGFAVLTSNSERAVCTFFDRFPAESARMVHLVGRETLGGPKEDQDVFRRGYQACLEATQALRGEAPPVYVGDASYELAFAESLGATPVSVLDFAGDEDKSRKETKR
jgi:phosphoglycolate phosphatase-like HAD superfamily hydrolase